jgi:hypothetical protein
MPQVGNPPFKSALVDRGGRMPNTWVKFFVNLTRRAMASPEPIGAVSVTAQAASLAATSVTTPILTAGRYQIAYYARVTQAATTSSSLSVTIRHTDGGVDVDQTTAAATGNTTGTVLSGTFIASVDASTTLKYLTTYASVGGTPMQYRLSLLVSSLSEPM